MTPEKLKDCFKKNNYLINEIRGNIKNMIEKNNQLSDVYLFTSEYHLYYK